MSRDEGDKGAPQFTHEEFTVLQKMAKKHLAWQAISADVRKMGVLTLGLLAALVTFRESILKLFGVE